MSFDKPIYMLVLFIVTIFFIFFRNKFYSNFFLQVKKFWFYQATKTRKISNLLYYLSFLILVVAVGDLRGKEEIIEGNIPTQKTLMIIDNSLSMLVEDIRPNRINKSLLMARHFIRNSYGHQVSIAVFSDILKQIIPFTDDIDILEARLQTLSDANSEGGSNIGLTLTEAFQYFKTKNGYAKGNIILFTDGEEHGDTLVKIPPEITMAVIAVGSENGGKIPLRSKSGQFQRYKKFNNEEITSKIDKKFFSALEKSGENVRVWFAQSYSLPTEEILSYLTKIHELSFQKGSFRQKPVKGIPLILLFVITYIISIFLSRFKTFKFALVTFLVIIGTAPVARAQDNEKLNFYLEKFKTGEISKDEKLELAELYMKMNENEKSSSVYRSTIKNLDEEQPEDIFNFATSLLKDGKAADAMSMYKYLDKERNVSDELRELIKKNMLLALNKDKKDNKENQEDQKDEGEKESKENKENKNGKQNKNKKNGDDKESKKNQSGDKKDKEQGTDKNEEKSQNNKSEGNGNTKEENKGEEKSSDIDKEEKKKQDQSKDKDGGKSSEQGKTYEEIKKEIELKKKNGVKGVLKQIMNDDANLQKLFINSSSKENSVESKDW